MATHDSNPQLPESPETPYDRRSARRMRREERLSRFGSRPGASWMLGAILIALGILLMLQNFNVLTLNNWWALFILLPAAGGFAAAWRRYQSDGGRLTAPARSALFSGFILTGIAAVFLFNLDWTILGPVLLILAGVGLLVNFLLPG